MVFLAASFTGAGKFGFSQFLLPYDLARISIDAKGNQVERSFIVFVRRLDLGGQEDGVTPHRGRTCPPSRNRRFPDDAFRFAPGRGQVSGVEHTVTVGCAPGGTVVIGRRHRGNRQYGGYDKTHDISRTHGETSDYSRTAAGHRSAG